MTDSSWVARSATDDERRQMEEMANKQKVCQVCAVPLVEAIRAVSISASRGSMKLVICQQCAAGMVTTILSLLPNEEVVRALTMWGQTVGRAVRS